MAEYLQVAAVLQVGGFSPDMGRLPKPANVGRWEGRTTEQVFHPAFEV
ncbi:hypothetical protein [Limnohabitans planktonicus]|nr:hypothetical protein [Limnohabitans planktonicus]